MKTLSRTRLDNLEGILTQETIGKLGDELRLSISGDIGRQRKMYVMATLCYPSLAKKMRRRLASMIEAPGLFG
jgi:hypothetical protein